MSLRIIVVSLFWLFVAAPAWAAVKDYDGPDGGWLVFSVTTGTGNPINTDVMVSFRAAGGLQGDYTEESRPLSLFHLKSDATAGSFGDRIRALVANASMTIMDGATKTDVYLVRLPAGAYEIYNIEVRGNMGNMYYTTRFSSHVIPFPITPGHTTYLGQIAPVPISVKGLFGLPRFIKWVRVITDENARDLPIAASRTVGLGVVDRPLMAAPPATGELPPGFGQNGAP